MTRLRRLIRWLRHLPCRHCQIVEARAAMVDAKRAATDIALHLDKYKQPERLLIRFERDYNAARAKYNVVKFAWHKEYPPLIGK